MAVTNKPSALSALTLSALAIPSVTQGATVPEKKQVSVRVTNYQEDPLPSARLLPGGSSERYGINVLQVNYFTPYKDQYSIAVSGQYETLSGASPFFSRQNAQGETDVFMSGATIDEKRLDGSVVGTRYFKEGTLATGLAFSTENDYQSLAFSLDGSLEIFDKHTTLLASMSTSFDELSPTDPELGQGRQDADGKSKRSFSIYEGVTQVLDKYSTLQVGVGYTRLKGHLTDPYKDDSRPDTREQTTLDVQYRRFVTEIESSVHVDYRYYEDDWGVLANTFSTSVWKDMNIAGLNFTLAPNLRYYYQHQADFYSVEAPTTEYYSSDFRLSAYGSFNLGIDIQFHQKDYTYTLGLNQYLSAEDWGLTGSKDTETPSLVNFTTISFGVDYKFK